MQTESDRLSTILDDCPTSNLKGTEAGYNYFALPNISNHT